jgi:hypothetical protein
MVQKKIAFLFLSNDRSKCCKNGSFYDKKIFCCLRNLDGNNFSLSTAITYQVHIILSLCLLLASRRVPIITQTNQTSLNTQCDMSVNEKPNIEREFIRISFHPSISRLFHKFLFYLFIFLLLPLPMPAYLPASISHFNESIVKNN